MRTWLVTSNTYRHPVLGDDEEPGVQPVLDTTL